MRDYNHRLETDLRVLEGDLSSLTPAQKATVWSVTVKSGLFKPLWPIRFGVWLLCKTRGDQRGLSRMVETLQKLPPTLLDKERDLFLEFLVSGNNEDDPTSTGRFNRRDLTHFLKIALRRAGAHRPDRRPNSSACARRPPAREQEAVRASAD